MSASTSSEPETRSLEGEYAGFVTRMIAFFIDILIINFTVLGATGVVVLIMGFFVNLYTSLPWATEGRFETFAAWVAGITAMLTLLVMLWLYPTLFWMINGQTFGKRVMGLRVVRMDGAEMTFWSGLVRVFGYWVSAAPLFLGFIWVLFSNKRRAWHDMMAHTCVIYAWDARGSEAMRSRLVGVRPLREDGES